MTTVTIPVSRQTKEKLRRLALRYGFSLQEFSRRILDELESAFPEERLSDYRNPKALQSSLNRGLADFRAGRTSAKL